MGVNPKNKKRVVLTTTLQIPSAPLEGSNYLCVCQLTVSLFNILVLINKISNHSQQMAILSEKLY